MRLYGYLWIRRLAGTFAMSVTIVWWLWIARGYDGYHTRDTKHGQAGRFMWGYALGVAWLVWRSRWWNSYETGAE